MGNLIYDLRCVLDDGKRSPFFCGFPSAQPAAGIDERETICELVQPFFFLNYLQLILVVSASSFSSVHSSVRVLMRIYCCCYQLVILRDQNTKRVSEWK